MRKILIITVILAVITSCTKPQERFSAGKQVLIQVEAIYKDSSIENSPVLIIKQ